VIEISCSTSDYYFVNCLVMFGLKTIATMSLLLFLID
jgi:hypothetical protein